jgi:SAM-dependent methyltransferase
MNVAEPSFDRIARPYRWLEYLTLGRALENCRLHYLPRLLDRHRALVLGDGDGRFLAQLLAQNSQLHADAVDTSATMLELLRQRCEATGPNTVARLHTHHANALTVPLEGPYDLVVTHFFLDCLTESELQSLITRIALALTPNALWLLSDFRIPNGLMRLPAKILVHTLYFAFRILAGLRTTHLPDHATALTQAGLIRISQHVSLAGLLITELWQTEPTP